MDQGAMEAFPEDEDRKLGVEAGYAEGLKLGYIDGFQLAATEAPKAVEGLGFILCHCLLLSQMQPKDDQSHWKRIAKTMQALRDLPLDNVEGEREAALAKVKARYREACQTFTSLPALPEQKQRALEF